VARSRLSRRSLGQRFAQLAAWPLADSAESHMRAEKVRILYRQGPPAQLLGIVAAAVICWVLWGVTDHVRLGIWWGTITAVIAGRMVLAARFQRRDPPPMDMPPWERAFVVSLGVVSLIWGVGGWLIMPPDSTLHQAVVFFFLLGVSGAVVTAYAAHAVAAIIAVLSVMLPATVAFAFDGAFEARIMAAGGAVYVVSSLRSTRILGFFLRRTFELSFELQQALARMRDQASTDELTGLANRRAFMALGAAAVDQAQRYQRSLSLLLVDIDHFKRINDTHGHAAGDAALRAVADALRSVSRTADTAGRLGGEEFALLLPETTAAEGVVLAERLRSAVTELAVQHGGVTIAFTCSIGVAEQGSTTDSMNALLNAADAAMYRAKAEGRDRVVSHTPEA
jgi:diguanylate cyclase (GGDEF)-like protein